MQTRIMHQTITLYDPVLCTGHTSYEIKVSGNCLGQCLEQLVHTLPDVKEWLFQKDGNLSNLVEIYINQKIAYWSGLETRVKDGDKIYIVMAVSCD